MEKEKYIEDLKEIRQLMNQASRFISLSGWSGISIGLIALIATYLAYKMEYWSSHLATYQTTDTSTSNIGKLLITGLITLVAAIISGIFFTYKKTCKTGEKIWTPQTQKMLSSFSLPLLSGGLVLLIFITKGLIGLIMPFSLIFYGLALINSSKYTLQAISNLGLLEVILGILSLNFLDASLIFWAFGFGVLHIIYGIVIPMNVKS